MKLPLAQALRRALLAAILIALAAPPLPSVPAPDTLTAEEIIQRLIEHHRQQEQRLASYQVSRRYHLENEVLEKDSDLRVEVTFNPPDTLGFEIRSQEGSGFIANQIWKRILRAEQEALQPERKRRSALTPENYTFEFRRREKLEERPAYVLAVKPKRADTFLFVGEIWIDAQDFALARAEGTVSKRPSFWIRRIQFVRSFKKVGPFWLSDRTEGVIEVLLFGTTRVTITNADYRVRLNPAKPVGTSIQPRGSRPPRDPAAGHRKRDGSVWLRHSSNTATVLRNQLAGQIALHCPIGSGYLIICWK